MSYVVHPLTIDGATVRALGLGGTLDELSALASALLALHSYAFQVGLTREEIDELDDRARQLAQSSTYSLAECLDRVFEKACTDRILNGPPGTPQSTGILGRSPISGGMAGAPNRAQRRKARRRGR